MSQTSLSTSQSIELPVVVVPFWYDGIKRMLDIIVSVIGLTVFSPLWLLIVIAIKATSRGPVLFRADALGKDGRLFRVYKFRTMCAGSGESAHKDYLTRYVERNEAFTVIKRKDGSKQAVYKIVNDPRVTRIGRLLRSTGLDEVPQFLNVVKGEMSLVGPRPPRPAEYEHYAEWQRQRLTVLPGITGLYQVTARSVVPFNTMVEIDLDYICRRSLWLDLKIMVITPFKIFKGAF